jgi:Ca2+-transporting ATPase
MEATELWTTDNEIHDLTEPYLQQNEPIKAIPTSSDLPVLPVDDRIAPQALGKSNSAVLTPLEYAMMVCALCNNASRHYDPDVREWQSVGNPTEVALLSTAQALHRGPNFWKRRYLSFEKHLEHAFDSTRRLMTIVYATTPIHLPLPTLLLDDDTQPPFLMVCKGAPEDILRRSTHYYASSVETLNDSMIQTALLHNERLASQGQRVIGLAVKFMHHQEHFVEQGLIFVGLIGLVDPAKRGVKEAIEVSQQAGISIIMITGDQAPTAMAMATQLGITHSATVKAMHKCVPGLTFFFFFFFFFFFLLVVLGR